MQNLTLECDRYFVAYMVLDNWDNTRKRANISISILIPLECIIVILLAIFCWKFKIQR